MPANSKTATRNGPSAAPIDQLGRPMRDLRISVTDRCNFRCPYCMPAEIYGERYEFLKREALLTFEEIERLATIGAQLGVEKLRITGGEPLVRAELPSLIAKLRAIPGIDDLAMTTNGFLLRRYAAELRDAGLDRITVSMDSLQEDVFKAMSGRDYGPDRVLDGIDAAREAGFSPLKINVVVQRGVNEHTLAETAAWFRETGDIVRFIEYMDVGNLNGWELSQVVSGAEIVALIDAEHPLEPIEANYPGEVASRYRYRDGSGEIGIITSVSQPFCRDCTRARLTTDGRLVTCLFATGGVDLKTPMRDGASDDELRHTIAGIWTNRRDRYSEIRTAATRTAVRDGEPEPAGAATDGGDGKRIEMFRLGG